MKKNMQISIPIILIFLIIIIGGIASVVVMYSFLSPFLTSYKRVKPKNEIINLYRENEKLFYNVLNELSKERTDKRFYWEFVNKSKEVVVKKYVIDENNDSDRTELDDDVSKYADTIKLIKKLDLESINYHEENIEFTFFSTMRIFRKIVYMPDKEYFKWAESRIKLNQIENNWYYVEWK